MSFLITPSHVAGTRRDSASAKAASFLCGGILTATPILIVPTALTALVTAESVHIATHIFATAGRRSCDRGRSRHRSRGRYRRRVSRGRRTCDRRPRLNWRTSDGRSGDGRSGYRRSRLNWRTSDRWCRYRRLGCNRSWCRRHNWRLSSRWLSGMNRGACDGSAGGGHNWRLIRGRRFAVDTSPANSTCFVCSIRGVRPASVVGSPISTCPFRSAVIPTTGAEISVPKGQIVFTVPRISRFGCGG